MPKSKKSIPYSKSRHKPRFVYALVDPRDSQIRYVGCTFDLKSRLTSHLALASTRVPVRLSCDRFQVCPTQEWLYHLIQNNERPLIVPIEECNIDNWRERENYWIVKLHEAGADLTNIRTSAGCDNIKHDNYKRAYRRSSRILRFDLSGPIVRLVEFEPTTN